MLKDGERLCNVTVKICKLAAVCCSLLVQICAIFEAGTSNVAIAGAGASASNAPTHLPPLQARCRLRGMAQTLGRLGQSKKGNKMKLTLLGPFYILWKKTFIDSN